MEHIEKKVNIRKIVNNKNTVLASFLIIIIVIALSFLAYYNSNQNKLIRAFENEPGWTCEKEYCRFGDTLYFIDSNELKSDIKVGSGNFIVDSKFTIDFNTSDVIQDTTLFLNGEYFTYKYTGNIIEDNYICETNDPNEYYCYNSTILSKYEDIESIFNDAGLTFQELE